MLNYAEVRKFIKDEEGKIKGVEILDKINDKCYEVKGHIVVNATGCFADNFRLLDDPSLKRRIVPAGGSHLILPLKYGSKKWGLLVPKTNDGRVLFVLPWLGETIVGTTERQYKDPVANPTVSQDEYLWLLRQYSKQFPLQQNIEVKSKWSGLRPLVMLEGYNEGEKINTKDVARSHVVEVSKSGLISIMGGKWTIFRQMGEDTVEEVLRQLEVKGIAGEKQPSISKYLRLVGDFERLERTNQWSRKEYIHNYASILRERFSMSYEDAKYLVRSYGERSFDLMKVQSEDESYREKLHKSLPHTKGEVVYLIRHEMAMKPQDVLFRRTRLGYLDAVMVEQVYGKLVDIFAEELKLTAAEKIEFAQSNYQEIRKMDF